VLLQAPSAEELPKLAEKYAKIEEKIRAANEYF